MKTNLQIFLILTLSLLFGCKSDYMSTTEAHNWIAAYSPETISPDSWIRIEPTDSLRKLINPKMSLENVFHFSPEIKGKAAFSDNGRFIDFYPSQGELREGCTYECCLNMSSLSGVKSMNDFRFTFNVERREVKMCDLNVRIDPDNIEKVMVTGTLLFSHPSDDTSAHPRQMKCSDKFAKIKLNRTDDEKVWNFMISNVSRKENDHTLEVSYVQVNSSAKTTQTVLVPGISEFKLHSADNNNSSEPHLCLEFTAPLDPHQDLEGLISIDRCNIERIERNGASVRVFYKAGGVAKFNLNVSELIRSSDGRNLKSDVNMEFVQELIPPAIKVPMSGSILPDGKNLIFPFKAVNLAAVDVEVVKIYSDNVLHFLQDNEIGDHDSMRRSGRLIYKRTVRLDEDESLDLHQWQNFSIDLNGLFKQERSAIYNVRLSFRKAYSLYDRDEPVEFEEIKGISEKDNSEWDNTYYYTYRSAPDYSWSNYSWKESDDPSKASYYMESSRMPEYNLLASNLGLIVKKSDNKRMWTTVTDIVTAAPLSGVCVTAYNYQLRKVGSGWTNEKGFADFELSGKPFVVTATDGVSTSYLKVNDGKEKSTSHFNVSGKNTQGGIKGYIYGERGIWRPGDDIYLTMIVEDKQRTLPANHPVTMELFTPDGVVYDRQTLTKGVNGFYAFCIHTEEDVQTGRWTAKFHVGGSVFNHLVQIESIVPNRLKINMDIPETIYAGSDVQANVNATWLTGVIAKGLKTRLEVTLFNNDKPFTEYPKYTFSNPLMDFSQSTYDLSSGTLDSLGNMTVQMRMPTPENAPGMFQANVLCKIAEFGGNESIMSKSIRYSPFSSYVGIDLSQKEYQTDTDLLFPVVTLDQDGKKLSGRRLEWKIYKFDWQWWWEGTAQNLSKYVEGEYASVAASGEVVTKDGMAEIPFRIDYPSWGKYLVFVRDVQSNHAAGGLIMIDWPEWRGRSDAHHSKGASILSFSMDKNKYELGESATIYLPASSGGRVLLSVENGSRVISRHWVSTTAGKETAYRLKVTKDMLPNFYVHATLLQPHGQTVNDLPVRLYGIQGAEVIDKKSFLHPQVEVPDVVLPQKEFMVKVKEQDGRPMTYTLAIVDEGLLDINGFKTPDAWRTMNMREALGVKTWDLYDNVIGAYAGKFTSVLSIGGDEALRSSSGKEKRFNPVVKFMGPFTTDGKAKTHKITLPMYVGSVRVMVVAAQNDAYGSAEKNVTVRSPLMLISTLPRVLSCGDKVNMPVNIFTTEDNISKVDVSVSVDGPIKIMGDASVDVGFSASGEKIVNFALSCDPSAEGTARVTVKAVSGGHVASETINIEVRNPHAVIVNTKHDVLTPGEEVIGWNTDNGKKVTLEIATLPSVNFEKIFSFVDNYQHFCTEQLSSRAMFLLYARRLLTAQVQSKAEEMLREILKEIASRQLPDGGFRYWNDSSSAHLWATSMAGEVMTEAMNQGFSITRDTYQKWIEFQIAQAKKYTHSTKNASDLQQAYRLYTLALAGKEQSAYMNRLKESKTISEQAKYRLAAAYSVSGKSSVAQAVLNKTSVTSQGDYSTFWSELRDDAMKLETLVLSGMTDEAMQLARQIADDFSDSHCSTQEVAFISAAFSKLAEVVGGNASSVQVSYDGSSVEYKNIENVKVVDIPASAGSLSIRNGSAGSLYLSLTTLRQPSADEDIRASANGAEICVKYISVDSQPVDISNLKQGDEFYAEIHVQKSDNIDSDAMALTFQIPSGWEIWNERIAGSDRSHDKMDIRDDMVCWYFSLDGKQTKAFKIKLRAAFEGRYIMPSTILEDMYRADCRACTASSKVIVSK